MKILNELTFTFDDLLIQPAYSTVESRQNVDTSTRFGNIKLKIPIIAANMDTICGLEMALAMGKLGGLGILHRFAPIEAQVGWVQTLKEAGVYAVPSVGVGPSAQTNLVKFTEAGADAVCIDVAHGNSESVFQLARFAADRGISVIIGNFATRPGYPEETDLPHNIIALKVGVGSGAACCTRMVAGVGVPQASAILNTAPYWNIISDGGIKKPADAAKAIGLGASAVMVGGYLAGTDETPVLGKSQYRGMASEEAQLDHKGYVSNEVAEGVSFDVERMGPVIHRINELVGGIRSAMSYVGAHTIEEFQQKVIFVRVSQASISENRPHFNG